MSCLVVWGSSYADCHHPRVVLIIEVHGRNLLWLGEVSSAGLWQSWQLIHRTELLFRQNFRTVTASRIQTCVVLYARRSIVNYLSSSMQRWRKALDVKPSNIAKRGINQEHVWRVIIFISEAFIPDLDDIWFMYKNAQRFILRPLPILAWCYVDNFYFYKRQKATRSCTSI